MLKKYVEKIEFLENLTRKWSFHILTLLFMKEALNFCSIKKSIPRITSKVLSSRLKVLEHAGFILREVLVESPLRVRYTLTEAGRNFLEYLLKIPKDVSHELQNNLRRLGSG